MSNVEDEIRPQIAENLDKYSNELTNHELDLIYNKFYEEDL